MPIEELLKLYYNKPPEGDEQTNNDENTQQREEQVGLYIFFILREQFRLHSLSKIFHESNPKQCSKKRCSIVTIFIKRVIYFYHVVVNAQ